MFQTQKEKLEKAMTLNQESTIIYGILGKYGDRLSEKVRNELRKDAEEALKKAEEIGKKLLK